MIKFLTLFFFPYLLFAAINSNGDYQIWQKNFIKLKIDKKWTFQITAESRFGDNVSKCYYCYIQPHLEYSLRSWIIVTPGYRQVAKRYPTNSVHWIPEYIPMFNISVKRKINGWEISNRNRVEYLISKSTNYPWVYRNRIRVVTPYHWSSIQITPYVENEFFLREGAGINQERVIVGLKESYTSHFGTEIAYMARFQKGNPHWIHQNVFYANLSFSY